jgi:para-nitrobenzyl esterase
MKTSRRQFLSTAWVAPFALRAQAVHAKHDGNGALVQTRSGTLRGDSADGVDIFRGIPFAEPPLGELRFRPPVKVKPWTGVRDATRFSAASVQPGIPNVPQSEDCLYLNIWAPKHKKLLPVFVWIHGGGFTGGYAFEPVYDGTQFANEDIVCVTVPYRLGALGFLDVAPVLGAGYKGSANNALRDLILALEWTKDNIAAFGGDPSHVTIGGESAGAKLTDILMGVPSARPLFHQVISESGGAERVWPASYSAEVSIGFEKVWKKQSPDESIKTAAADQLIVCQQAFTKYWPQHFPLRAELDGDLIPRLPIESISAGSTRGKRLLIGTNRDESALFLGPHPQTDPTAADLGNIPLAQFNAVFAKYKTLYPELNPEQLIIRVVTAEEYWIPSVRVAEAHIRSGGKAFMYRLDFAETSGRYKGEAYHSLDVGLVWNKPHRDIENAAAEAALARQVHALWASFIRGEAPATTGSPAWPQYNPNSRPTMILDDNNHIEQNSQDAERHLWDGTL